MPVETRPSVQPSFPRALIRHRLRTGHSRNATENTAPELVGSMVKIKGKIKFPLGGTAVKVVNGVLQENLPWNPGLGGGRLLGGSDS